jgi:spore coat protein U-like protein
MKKLLFVAACLASFSTAALASPVLTATTTLPVEVTLIPAVTVVTSPLNFGVIIPGDGSDAAGSVSVTATNLLPYKILLDGGINPVGPSRTMLNAEGVDHIPYTLTSDVNRSNPWGDDGITLPDPGVNGEGNGGAQIYFVYGRMSTDRLMPAGVYSDTVTVTVTY